MGLKLLVNQCGQKAPVGVEVELLLVCSCELAAWPALTGTGNDADVRLNEAFDFTGAATGEGYFRRYTAIVDKNSFDMGIEGEVGNEDLFSGFDFYIRGTAAEQAQFAVDMAAASSCLVGLMKPRKSTDYVVCGTKQVPAYVETLEFNSGKKVGDGNGTTYRIRANTNLHYYAESLGVNETPAV